MLSAFIILFLYIFENMKQSLCTSIHTYISKFIIYMYVYTRARSVCMWERERERIYVSAPCVCVCVCARVLLKVHCTRSKRYLSYIARSSSLYYSHVIRFANRSLTHFSPSFLIPEYIFLISVFISLPRSTFIYILHLLFVSVLGFSHLFCWCCIYLPFICTFQTSTHVQ